MRRPAALPGPEVRGIGLAKDRKFSGAATRVGEWQKERMAGLSVRDPAVDRSLRSVFGEGGGANPCLRFVEGGLGRAESSGILLCAPPPPSPWRLKAQLGPSGGGGVEWLGRGRDGQATKIGVDRLPPALGCFSFLV